MPVLFDLFKIKDKRKTGGSGAAGSRDAQGSILLMQRSYSSRCEGQMLRPAALRALDLK